MNSYTRSNLMLLSFILSCAQPARAEFVPIALTPDSYNQDVVVERTAPPPVAIVTTASMDQGTSNLGSTWFERGYLPEWPATGIPEAGSILASDLDPSHQYQMPRSYTNKNAILIDAVRTNALLTLSTPTNCNVLSFLTSSGVARNQIYCTVHYANHTSESATFISPNWYSDGDPAWAANGHVNVATFTHGDLNSYNPRLYSVDLGLTNATSPIVSIELSLASGSGHTAIFAASGASSAGGLFVPIEFTGFNEDLVVEASAIKPGSLDTNTTATMDNGTANSRFTWYERGFNPAAPESGLPKAGSLVTSESDASHSFLMPPSYTDLNATLIDTACNHSLLRFETPAYCSTLSFLTASGHGPVTNQCVIRHSNGKFETNSLVSPDWVGNSAAAFTAHGRVSVSTKLTDNVNAGSPRLYAVDLPVADKSSPVTSVLLSLLGAGADAHSVVFAVSGSSATITPPSRPALLATTTSDGSITIQSTLPGRLQSCTALSGAQTIWKDLGAISHSLTFTISSAEPTRFYRVVE